MLSFFERILNRELRSEAKEWLSTVLAELEKGDMKVLTKAFSVAPRHTGKLPVHLSESEKQELQQINPELSYQNYTADKLARTVILMRFPNKDKQTYVKTISELFKAAEMNELATLYSALPFLFYPEEWVKQCADGIRSNIGVVLEAIMLNNPYPAKYLGQAAWNQLVLKAFFTEKPVDRIVGLDQRANQELAHILSDYAHERWAAGRLVDPQLWRLMAGFVDQRILEDLKKVLAEGNKTERTAAALVCQQSEFQEAKVLLNQYPDLKSEVVNSQLGWSDIANPILVT